MCFRLLYALHQGICGYKYLSLYTVKKLGGNVGKHKQLVDAQIKLPRCGKNYMFL